MDVEIILPRIQNTRESAERKYEIPGFLRRQYVDVYITVGSTS